VETDLKYLLYMTNNVPYSTILDNYVTTYKNTASIPYACITKDLALYLSYYHAMMHVAMHVSIKHLS